MQTVAKKKSKQSEQVVFRVSEETMQSLRELSERFGQDVSGFLRLILSEQLPAYRCRAERMERGGEQRSE